MHTDTPDFFHIEDTYNYNNNKLLLIILLLFTGLTIFQVMMDGWDWIGSHRIGLDICVM